MEWGGNPPAKLAPSIPPTPTQPIKIHEGCFFLQSNQAVLATSKAQANRFVGANFYGGGGKKLPGISHFTE